MRKKLYIAILILLGVMTSGGALYGADTTCPNDSIIGRSEDGSCTYREFYLYDSVGRTIQEEKWSLNDDSVLIGQNKSTTIYYPNGKTQETATWVWSDSKQDWIGSTKYEYLYDSVGNQTAQIIYQWSLSNDGWENNQKTEYQYNSNNQKVLITTYTGSGTEWNPQTLQEYQYEGNTKILDRYSNGYDSANHTWIGSSWKVWEYHSAAYSSGITLYEEYEWKDGTWSGKTKYDAEYNRQGRTILKRNYTNYNPISQTWENNTELHYEYDQWDNISLNEQYKWQDGNWVGWSKSRYGYTAYQSERIMTATFLWDTINNKFIGQDSILLAKDGAGNQVLDEQYNWQNDGWYGTKKEEYLYDSATNKISTITYDWLQTDAKWINDTKDSAQYNENRLKVLEAKYKWNTADGGYWEGTGEKSVSEYTNNMQTLKEVYIWKSDIKDWTYKTKIKKEYSGSTLILDEEYELQTDGQFKGTKKERYIQVGRKKTTVKYSWLYDEVWQGQDSVIADYDTRGNQTLDEQYQWAEDGGYWRGLVKGAYTYNSNKKVLTSHEWAWNDTPREWIDSVKTEARYDTWKNLIFDERYTYDVAHSQWIGTLKKEYQYNDKGEQIMFANYTWEETKFIGTQKEEKALDDEGRVIMQAKYDWGTNDWKGKSKDSTTYFRNDTIAEQIAFAWQTNKWVESKKTKDTYSDDGLHTATANYTWSGGWVGVKQTTWTYVAPGKVDTAIVSKWNGGDWENQTRRVNTYTDGNVTGYVDYKWENSDWVNVARWEQEDKNTEYSYEWLNSDWVPTQENKKTYDDQNRLILETKQNWIGGVQQGGSKTVYVYTGDKMTLQTDSAYAGGQWMLTQRITNTYTDGKQTLAMKEGFTNGLQTEGSKTTQTYQGDQLTNETQYTWNEGWKFASKTDHVYSGNIAITANYTSSDGTTWQGVDSLINEFGEGSDVITTKFEWQNSTWTGISKTGYTYYTSGKEKSVVDYSWDGATWNEFQMTEYVYSGTKNKVTTVSHKEETGWVGDSKTGVYYDEGENETSASWAWTDNGWKPASKSGITLYDNGKTKSQTTYKISGDDFVYNTRTTYVYGTGDKDVTKASYKWNGSAWLGVEKKGEVWEGGKQTQLITYNWVSDTTWQFATKTENEYGARPTTATFIWDTGKEDWKGVTKSGTTYEGDKIASELSFIWDDVNWTWQNEKMTEYTYGTGNDKSVASYVGNGDEWVGVMRYEETYTEQGDSLGFYTQCWKDGAWADSLKTEFTYDERGNTIFFIQAKMVDGAWKNSATSKWWELLWDEQGRDTIDAHYKWNERYKKWFGETKTIYVYDDQGNLIVKELDLWGGTKWRGNNKYIWSYNDAGKITLSEVWSWDTTNKKWRGTSRTEYGYFRDTIKCMTAVYRWNTGRPGWEGVSKDETVYDDVSGQVIASCQYTWSEDIWDWIGMVKFETVYDNKNRVIEQTQSSFDGADWYNNTKSYYAYDDKHGQIEKKEYTFYSGDLVLTYHSLQTYDQDSNSKLRTDLSASWNTDGSVDTYQRIAYYYACDPKYQVTVEASPAEGGRVDGGGEYILNGQATISAKPDPDCYKFDHWSDGDTNASRTFLVTESKTYTAIFTPVKRTVNASVAPNGGGSVSLRIKQPNE